MSKLSILIKNEYLTDVRQKGFWIATILGPVLMVAFGAVMGYLLQDADTYNKMSNEMVGGPDPEKMTAAKAAGMMVGVLLMIFLMMYGAMIFNKVKAEKCNRIMEILSTCVDGRTMMFAKIISVGLVGMTQLLAWASIGIVIASLLMMIFPYAIPWDIFTHPLFYMSFIYMLLFFIGGYVLYGALYAACGAITDTNNENQGYMTLITMILLAGFYIGQFAIDQGSSTVSVVFSMIPFTSPIVATINAISGAAPVWQTIVSLVILYGSAALCVTFAGKLYRSSLLMKGKNFTPRDLITFIKQC